MPNQPQSLLELLAHRLARATEQRITFAEYMELVLYQPQYGYYGCGNVHIGSRGDFFTSVSLGADFGELLAEQFRQMWQLLGYPQPFNLVEIGAGQGILAADILQYLQRRDPHFLDALTYTIVEYSPQLINRQQAELKPWLEQGYHLQWHSWAEIEENSLVGCCFANELVDAFPVHQVVVNQGKLEEIYVTLAEEKLQEITGELSTSQLAEYFALVGVDLPSDNYGDGYRTQINLAALDWLATVAQRLQKGYLLTIDYGYTAQRYYHPQRREGTLQCYYQHRRHNNPYLNLGKQDITAHIDFTALIEYGQLSGLHEVGFTRQGMFLMALGLGERLAELSTGKLDVGQLLKRRDALHQLIDPAGLGNFGVLVQATEDCREFPLKGLTFDI